MDEHRPARKLSRSSNTATRVSGSPGETHGCSRTTTLRATAATEDVSRTRFFRGTTRAEGCALVRHIGPFMDISGTLSLAPLATQDIDSRDWMHADSPGGLTKNVARVIDPEAPEAASVTETLGRDIFIDYVADTGDERRGEPRGVVQARRRRIRTRCPRRW